VSQDIAKNFDPQLSDDELRQIRLKLDAAGVRLLTYYIQDIPNDEAGCRKIFEFGRKMGIETFMSEPKPEALELIDKFCMNTASTSPSTTMTRKLHRSIGIPKACLKACQGRSKRIGACGDLGYWMRSGIDPIQAARMLKTA